MTQKKTLSVTVLIPVLNEEKRLPECLRSLRDRFESVIVVDSGSKDATCAVAERMGAHVINFKWDGRYPKKRNWALEHADISSEWVLFLDADERVTPSFIEELDSVLSDTPHSGFRVSFDNSYRGQPLHYGDVFRKLILFRYGAGQYEYIPEQNWSQFDMEVHEHPIIDGSVGILRARLEHVGPDDEASARRKHEAYAEWEANRYRWYRQSKAGDHCAWTVRQKVKYSLLSSGLLGPLYFIYSYVFKLGFLDGLAGWRFARMKYRYFCDICARLKNKKSGRH